MATFDNFFIAKGPGPLFAGLQSVPFGRQTAQFRVGVYGTGTSAGLQGIALSTPEIQLTSQSLGRPEFTARR